MDSYLICKIPDCGQNVKKQALKSHAVTHLTKLRFRCSVCNYRAQLKKNVEMHQKYRHNGGGDVVDEKDKKYDEELESIMEQCFYWESSPSEEEIEEQEMNEESVYEDVRQGSSSKASNEEPFVLEPVPTFEMRRQSNQKNMLICQIQDCGQKINPGKCMYGLRAHAIVHHPIKRFQCTVCSFLANGKEGVLLHQKAKHTGQGLVLDRGDDSYFDTLEEFIVKCFPSAADRKRKPRKSHAINEQMIIKEEQNGALLASNVNSSSQIVPLSSPLRESSLSKTNDDSDKQEAKKKESKNIDVMCQIPGCEQVMSSERNGMKHLRIHAISHHPLKRFHCSMCIHASSVKKALEGHQRRLHGGQGSVVDIADKYYYEVLTTITRKCFPNYAGRNVSKRKRKLNEIERSLESDEQKEAEDAEMEKEDGLKVSNDPVEPSEVFDDTNQHLEIKDEPIFEEDAMDVESLLKSSTTNHLLSEVKEEINLSKEIPVLLLNVKDEKSPLEQIIEKVKNEC
ncbi:unnamed protein product, partial [Mesorhabditis belari]|uniref:C2H2-type domain-containing protein n=1 Tax=Mesorhabditis belari TaxID=2138241 RepID=A0AAF3EZ41_9BILA